MYDYFNAIISATTSPDDAFNKFDILAQELIALLRKSHMKIQVSINIRGYWPNAK